MKAPACPLPHDDAERVTLAHGGGGARTEQLVREVFVPALGTSTAHDGAVLAGGNARIATTTDAFVVRPLFFPGADIGTLAVNGTVNDLAMCGARPLALTASFIIEEGLPLAELERVAVSMGAAARAAGVSVAAGDTKVVERGRGDGLYVSTAGIGALDHELDVHPRAIRAGDVVLLSGDIGRHGMAVMAARDGLTVEPTIASDCAPLWPVVAALLAAGVEIHCLRDLTRGGLAGGLVELARSAGRDIEIDEAAIAVPANVAAACELLGLDPLHVANEGRCVAIVAPADADRALAAMRGVAVSAGAAFAGVVQPSTGGRVRLRTRLGTVRHVAMLSGEQLPRIC